MAQIVLHLTTFIRQTHGIFPHSATVLQNESSQKCTDTSEVRPLSLSLNRHIAASICITIVESLKP